MNRWNTLSAREAMEVQGGDWGLVIVAVGVVLCIRFWSQCMSLFGR